jgi:hypothetical protein
MEGGDDIAILDICQAADVQHELRSAAFYGNLVTGFLYITIG